MCAKRLPDTVLCHPQSFAGRTERCAAIVRPLWRSVRTISRRSSVLIIAVMVAAVLFLSVPGHEMWRKVLQDSGHGLVFFVIGIVLALMQEPRSRASSRSFAILFKAFVVAVAIGVATEWLQHFEPGRSVSAMDALHDAAGAAFGLAVLAIVERKRPSSGVPPTSPAGGRGKEPSPGVPPTSPAGGRGKQSIAFAIALAAFTTLAWQPLQAAPAYAARAAAFPTLADGVARPGDAFLAGRNARVERGALPVKWARHGDGESIHLRFDRAMYPGIDLFEPSPDWRGFSTMAIDVTNPGASTLNFTLRINDQAHDQSFDDRLNLPIAIPPGVRTTVRVALTAVESAPRGRHMDLSRIASVMLFSHGPPDGAAFYVSRIWLE